MPSYTDNLTTDEMSVLLAFLESRHQAGAPAPVGGR
jgi:hypothetical protein